MGKETEEYSEKQRMLYSKLKEIMLQNVNKSRTKTFTQYTKSLIQSYIQNPFSNINNIRAVSQFLMRNSMIYKKIIDYFAQMPLFYYNLTYKADFEKGIDYNKMIKSYQEVSQKLQEIHMQKEFSTVIATALRDGVYYGFVYDGDGDGFFIHALDPQYCKISAYTGDGEYIIAFNASYFDSGNNDEYLYGIDEDNEGTWDQVFIDGYETYKSEGRDYMWFELPPEKTICILADDDADMPLPYFLPVFTSLLDLLDLESILASKTELENYVLLLSKIPLVPDTDEVDDFAVSIELVQMVQDMIDEVVPDLVATAYTPCDVEAITFDGTNTADDTDELSTTMSNLFKNMGISELVVSSGTSTNSVGLKHSIQNDETLAFKLLDRIGSWMNAYIKANYSEEFIFKFHRESNYLKEDYQGALKDAAQLGLPVAIDYATSLGQTPYEMMCATLMENALGLKNGLWEPLSSSYTQSAEGTSDSEAGRPQSDDDELTAEGIATRDGDKNGSENA